MLRVVTILSAIAIAMLGLQGNSVAQPVQLSPGQLDQVTSGGSNSAHATGSARALSGFRTSLFVNNAVAVDDGGAASSTGSGAKTGDLSQVTNQALSSGKARTWGTGQTTAITDSSTFAGYRQASSSGIWVGTVLD